MQRYRSHKVVEAAPIHAVYDHRRRVEFFNVDGAITAMEVDPNIFARGLPVPGDYLVRYSDGYLSWSPKAAFEEGYTLMSDGDDAASLAA